MTHLSLDEIAHLEQLIARLTSRIQLREIQIAQYGSLNADPHIISDKQEAEQQLAEARAKLRRLRPAAHPILRPYVGLATFQEDDAAFFFGREKLVAELVQKADCTSFLTVLGPSGSGKSSVIRAGLIPELKKGALPGSANWRYVTMRPTKTPLKALEKALDKVFDDTPIDGSAFRPALYDHTSLRHVADLLFANQNGGRLVLTVDQAEELWTSLPLDPVARKTFIDQQQRPFLDLLLAAAQPDSRVLIVLTLRADFLHRAAEHHELAQTISSHNVIVSPMRREELRATITRPAEAIGCGFEQGLVDELIEQTLNRPGALPLLEYTLHELWVDRQPDGTLTWAAFRTLGGVEGALARRADTILEERYPSIEQQEELRAILLSLIQPGEGIADTRRRVALRDLASTSNSIDAVQALLKPLVDERLITAGRDQASGEETVEVSHEALIQAWPTLNEWINEYRDDLRFQIQLEEAAKEWAASGKSPDFLWSGLRLANAVAWRQRAQSRLNERTAHFLDASYATERQRVEAEDAARREREQLLQARAAATVQAQAAAEREAQARAIAEAQARAGEALFDLSRGNVDQALLLSRAAVATTADVFTPLVSRALRRVFEDTLPNRRLHGHSEDIKAAVWSPDGRELLTGADDKTVRIWDASTGQQLQVFQNHPARVISVAWSPNKQHILAGRDDGTAVVWDARTGAVVKQLNEQKTWLTVVQYSPDGTYILVGGERGDARIYRSADFKPVLAFHSYIGRSGLVSWSPDGRKLLARDEKNTAFIWDIAQNAGKQILSGHSAVLRAAKWSPDGQYVATGSDDNTARVWDAESGTTVQILQGHANGVREVAWSPDGRYILTGSADHTARIWEAASGAMVQILQGHTKEVWGVAWSPDGRYILTSSADRTSRIWEIASGTIVGTLGSQHDFNWRPSWNPFKNQLLIGNERNTAHIYDMSNALPVKIFRGHSDKIRAAAWSPNGRHVITSGADRTARIWDTKEHRLMHILDGHKGEIWTVAWSPDGRYVVTGCDDQIIRLWDAATGSLVRKINKHPGSVKCIAWSPNGKYIAFAGMRRNAYILDVVNDVIVQELAGHQSWIRCVAWSPDGEYLITGSADETARVWDRTSAQTVHLLAEHKGRVSAVAWHPLERKVLTGGADGLIRIWDLPSGTMLHAIEGRTDWIRTAGWSSNGELIIAGGSNGVGYVWEARTGRLSQVLEGHTGSISAAAWSPDDQYILTSSDDATARISIADIRLVVAEITRRICYLFTDAMIRKEIPTWRGRDVELGAIKDELAIFDELSLI